MWIEADGDVGDEKRINLGGAWTMKRIAAILAAITESRRAPKIDAAQLAELFIGEGW
jgi:hypothetical protein